MPTYDYECPFCKHRFEVFSRLHDTATKPCPRCGKKKSKRLIGAGAGFIFKGSGFYVTDSRKSSGGDAPAAKPESASALKGSEARPSGSAPKGSEALHRPVQGEARPSGTAAAESKPKKKANG